MASALGLALGTSLLWAEEPYVEFLEALKTAGQGEMALEYLDRIAAKPNLPRDLRETLDLERSRCLGIAANEAYDAQERAKRLTESVKLFEQFEKANPEHPALGAMVIRRGDDEMLRGQMLLGQVRGIPEVDKQEPVRQEARAALTEARKHFTTALTSTQKQFEPLRKSPPTDKAGKERFARLEIGWLEARFKLALADLMLAQTYADPKAASRIDLLRKATKSFDEIFQEYRGQRIAYLAHMWHGKTLEDLGDKQTAMDIYDEVLVASPEGVDTPVEDAPLFGQAALFRLKLLGATEGVEDLIIEADEWIKLHRRWSATPVYQGIALELGKAQLKYIKTAPAATQKKLQRETAKLLGEIGKVDSEYRHEALLLRRELMDQMGKVGEAAGVDELIVLGDEAAGAKNWEGAIESYTQAIALAEKTKKTEQLATANEKRDKARYYAGVAKYEEGDYAAAQQYATDIVRDNPKGEAALDATTLAMACTLKVYGNAPEGEKDAQFKRIENIAKFTISSWPDAPAADDARMTLAQAHLMKGDNAAALTQLDEVKPQAQRFGTAKQIAGQLRWTEYIKAKQSGPPANDPANLKKLADPAIIDIEASLASLKTGAKAGEPLSAQVLETEILLAEMHLERLQPDKALPLYQEMVAHIEQHKPAAVDKPTLRTFVGALRAALAQRDLASANKTVEVIAATCNDSLEQNAVLIDLTKLVGSDYRKTESAMSLAQTAGDRTAQALAKKWLGDLQKLQGAMVAVLAGRQHLDMPQTIYLGDAASAVNDNQAAGDLYKRALAMVDKDPKAQKESAATVTRVRSKVLGLLRNEGKLEEARKQVDKLIEAHPNALEPLMEKGRILEQLAAKDAKLYEDCVAHWTSMRIRLAATKPSPPEYYEALANAAQCLIKQSVATKDTEKALQAERMLKSTMVLQPKLNGADTVAKFNAIVAEAAKARGAAPKPENKKP